MMLPVKHEGRVVGVVQLMTDRLEYTKEQLELAEGLVGLMGASARNARLYQKAQSEAAARARAEATAAEREHAARVLEAVGDGVFLLDDDGVIRLWNREAELVTGRPREDALGRTVGELFDRWETVAREIPVAEGRAPARPVTLPVDCAGRELWLSFVAVRSSAGVVYTFRDLSSERRLDEVQSDFIATVSHELRTPMTAVLGAAKTLLRDDIDLAPERRRELLRMIGDQGTRLTQITEEILLASRLERGELRLETSKLDLGELVRATVETMRQRLPSSISLTTELESNGAAVGDRDRVEQVLVNLLDNAIKYSPDGGAVVVSTARVPEAVRVSVKDHGIGIPHPEQSAIFEKFYRADPHLKEVPGGTGLGLYISRELVQRMGGRIGVRSQLGAGSTFFFELPSA
jgi:two-component system phosphate regulon sensor histidine kinase PhoR